MITKKDKEAAILINKILIACKASENEKIKIMGNDYKRNIGLDILFFDLCFCNNKTLKKICKDLYIKI